jgi:hypothetical protein
MTTLYMSNIQDYQNPREEQKLFFNRMPEEKYEYKEHYLVIDSRDRDRTIFPNPNNYTIQFDNGVDGNIMEKFRNIVSIQLVDGHVPNAVTASDPYITLDIPELHSTYAGTNNHLSNTFALLNPETKGTAFARFKLVAPGINKFRTPIASLNKLTFQFKDYNGDFYDFGTDATPPAVPTIGLNNSLIFKLTTRERDFKLLDPILT